MQVVADQDQLDVGRLGGGEEAVAAGRAPARRRSPGSSGTSATSAAAAGVAVDDHGAGLRLVDDEPGERRRRPGSSRGTAGRAPASTMARAAANWARRPGAVRAPDQRVGPARRAGQGRAVGHLAPGPRTAAAARSACRRRWPSRAPAASSAGPAAVAAAKVAGSWAGTASGPTRSAALSSARLSCATWADRSFGSSRSACRAKPQAEGRLGLGRRHLARDRDLAWRRPTTRGRPARRELGTRGGGNAQAASVSTRTGRLRLLRERPAGQPRDRRLRGRSHRRAAPASRPPGTSGTARPRDRRSPPARWPRRPPSTGSGLSSAAASGGTAEGCEPAHVPDQEVVLLARQPRPPQRLDQERHGVRARLAEAADGVVLLLGASASGRR